MDSDVKRQEGFAQGAEALSPEEMERINRYTRREYGPQEVYAFSLVLCDNEVDRDGERFSLAALDALRELFLGRTCILDHERKSANQTARIYQTELETEPDRRTQAGEPYTRLTARAYLPRTRRNEETIALIESGILKEVSISCAVARRVCSVCGETDCAHEAGQWYGGVQCVRILEEPTDAYECSFVAVPAQREAGVRKAFVEDGEATLEKALGAAARGDRDLTPREARLLAEELTSLRQQAAWGAAYRKSLQENALRYCAVTQPGAPREVLEKAFAHLTAPELEALSRGLEREAALRLPIRPQTLPEKSPETAPAVQAYRI